MNRARLVAPAVSAAFLAPAALSLAADAIKAATGIPASDPIAAAFAWLGVTNYSPLPVRQAWYLGVFIVAPLVAAALAAAAAAVMRPRWPLAAITSLATVLALFWTVRSLLDD